MNKSVIALLGLAVVLGGCSNQVSYGDAQAVETTTIDFGSTDLQTIAGEMLIVCSNQALLQQLHVTHARLCLLSV
ncbi:lipoprotein YcfM [Vibrio ponticus]|nr:lipoprotein YcfM [Vibrio ponticus]